MTGQSTDAAERSAHVTRGAAAAEPDAPSPIAEWVDADGVLHARLRCVVELEAEIAALRKALSAISLECSRARGQQSHRDACRFADRTARAALSDPAP